ncbi:MAG TPA: hypothetical protein VI749_03685 [Candidatus Omnitrophota bacterium]|nr:hypothetical protein [Candidatus Omnitrophota bacterium]
MREVKATAARRPAGFLLWIPVGTYAISYLYLAIYHQQWFLWNKIVHEGGTYTLLQDMFYASHFWGHIPVHTLLAFLFIGTYLCLAPDGQRRARRDKTPLLLALLIGFLWLTLLLSLAWFGKEDTLAFIAQQKQGVTHYEQGGSWNLHLPSTMMQFLLIPAFIYAVMSVFKREIAVNQSGLLYVFLSLAIFFLLTIFLNKSFLQPIQFVWQNPRYLAHSVRELVTFPLTYYPLVLYFLFREKTAIKGFSGERKRVLRNLMIVSFLVFCVLFVYQAYLPLQQGIGELAQKPVFAKGGELPVLYLLASHYFEHFLDTVYFLLLSLLLYGLARRQRIERV